MPVVYRSSPIRYRADAPAPIEGQPKVIEGYFVVFDQPYEVCPGLTEMVDRHAFDNADMSDVRALIDHDSRLVLGRSNANVSTLTIEIDDVGLYGRIEVNEDDSDAVNAWARNRRRDVDQASFGFEESDVEWIDNPDGSCHRIIRGISKLWEISLCTFPAYEQTAVSARASDAETLRKERLEHKKSIFRRKFRYGKK